MKYWWVFQLDCHPAPNLIITPKSMSDRTLSYTPDGTLT